MQDPTPSTFPLSIAEKREWRQVLFFKPGTWKERDLQPVGLSSKPYLEGGRTRAPTHRAAGVSSKARDVCKESRREGA